VCVDIETDGMNYQRGHVIEVAVLRIEGGEIVDEFSSLVNPGVDIPPFITGLTGITTSDVQSAPAFDDLAERLLEIMDGAVFVAHNVRFDFSFLKQEFRRVGLNFKPSMLCTVKLSRALYPEVAGHSLSKIIARHNLSYSARHRAYDDAHALYQLLHVMHRDHGEAAVFAAARRQSQLPSLPRHLTRAQIDALPNKPGVYIFRDEQGAPLYVGKSVNIRRRVLSHFVRDSEEYREFKMAQLVYDVSYHVTAGELSALLLESHLVKTLHPLYNRKLRRQRQFVVAKYEANAHGYYRLIFRQLHDIPSSELATILGVYTNRSKAKASVLSAVRTYDLCPRLCGLEKGEIGSCFSYQLGRCRGACSQKEPSETYNARLLGAFERTTLDAWPYKGAVSVSESQDHASGFIVDNWRIIGAFSSSNDGDDMQLTAYDNIFDIDAYKIVRAFFRDKHHTLSIKPHQSHSKNKPNF